MKFSHPEMFYLIWAVALLCAVSLYGSYKRKKIMSRFVSTDRSQSIIPESSPGKQRLKSALILMAAVLLIFTLAGPLAGFKWETIEQKGVDLVICLDCSRSMLAADIKPTRLERAKREIVDLLNMMTSDRAGLVAFAGQALVQCPLTLDYRAFHIFLNALDPDFFPVGGTNISAAIETAVNAFDKQVDSDKAVILITDGENTSGEPVKIAQQAAEQGIKVFCVGVGSSDGAPVPDRDGGFKTDSSGTIILSKADDKGLRRIAAAGSGIYVKSVAGDMDLDLIYRDHIARTMERKTLKSSKRKVWENRYQWVLLPCVMLLLTEMLVQRRKKSSLSGSDAVSKPADSQKYSRGDESQTKKQTQKRRPGTSFFTLFIIIAGFVAAYPLFFPFPCQASYASSVQKGIECYNENQFEKAEKYFIDAQLKQPDMPEMYYNIGAAAYKTEDYEAAIDNFLKACDTDDISLKQKALYNIGNTNVRLGKLKQAIKAYEQVLENNPDHLKAKENLSFAKKKLEEKQKQQDKQDQNKDKKDQDKDKNKNKDKTKDQTEDTDRNKDKEPDRDKDQGKDQNKDNSQNNDSRHQTPKDQNPKDQNQMDQKGKHQNRQHQQDRNGLKDQKNTGPDKRQPDLNPGDPGQTEKSGETGKSGKEEGSQQGRSAGKQNKGDSPGNNNMNQRLLNRLEDSPGKALMPAYGSQTVEKDW